MPALVQEFRMSGFSKQDIQRLFHQLNDELLKDDIQCELYLVGGAVMCLVYDARASTQDVDGVFKPVKPLRDAASRVALNAGIKPNWLNDGVKGFLSEHGSYTDFLELSHLKVMTASAAYLLARKCLAMRIGEEFHDLDDVRYLLRNLDVQDYEQACELITQYYPIERFPQKTLYVLEELFNSS